MYQYHLHNKCEEHDCYEEPIVEKVFKDVQFLAELTAIYLVENLHEYKSLEQYCVQNRFIDLELSLILSTNEGCVIWIFQVE